VQRSVNGLARVWTPRTGTGRAATSRQLHNDLDNFEARLAMRPVPPAEPKPESGEGGEESGEGGGGGVAADPEVAAAV
jgi:hypothetical protein